MARLRSIFTLAVTGLCLALVAEVGGAQAAVRGTVRDSASRSGIAGAIVRLTSGAGTSSVRSDEGGKFEFYGLANGAYRVAVIRIGYRPAMQEIRMDGADAQLTIDMTQIAQKLAAVKVGPKGAGIYGIIGAATDQRPLADMKVYVAGTAQSTVTDSTGEFFVPIKKPGMYIVRVTGKGFAEDLFPVAVPAEQVVDASRLLDASDRPPISQGLIDDMDQRLRWRGNNSALVTGSEIREVGGSLGVALATSPSVVREGLILGGCLIVDGVAHPDWPIDAIRPEEVVAVEVYGGDKEVLNFLGLSWPKGTKCSAHAGPTTRGNRPEFVRYIVIWTKR